MNENNNLLVRLKDCGVQKSSKWTKTYENVQNVWKHRKMYEIHENIWKCTKCMKT